MSPSPRQLGELRCDVLFDGVDVIRHATVEIEADRIVAVHAGERDPRDKAGVASLSTPFAMPGLVDAHVHCIGDGNLARVIPADELADLPDESPQDQVDAVLQLAILAGTTTVRDVGNHLATIDRVRAQSPDTVPPAVATGPRIAAAGPLLGDLPLVWRFTQLIADEAAARNAVDDLARAGVDLVCAYRGLDEARLQTVIRAADDHGLPVAVNTVDVAPQRSAALGARSIEHGTFLLTGLSPRPVTNPRALLEAWAEIDPAGPECERLGEQLAEHHTFVVPTLVLARRWALLDEVVGEPMLDWMLPVMPFLRHFKRMRNPWGWRIGKRYLARYAPYQEPSRDQRRRIETGFRRLGELLCRLHDLGVPLAAGSDAPTPSVVPGFALHGELWHLVDIGLTPQQALVAATSAAAELVGRSDIGRIVPGARADVVLCDANPLQNIDHLRQLRHVLLGGCLVDRDGIADRLRRASARVEAGSAAYEKGVAHA